jgi:hypothetical protein
MRTLAFCAALAFLAPAAARADDASDFRDFRIPASRAVSWVGDVGGYANWNHSDSRDRRGVMRQQDLNGTHRHFVRIEDDRQTLQVDDALRFSGTRRVEQHDDRFENSYFGEPVADYHDHSVNTDAYTTANLSVRYDRYSARTPLFVTTTSSAALRDSRYWDHSSTSESLPAQNIDRQRVWDSRSYRDSWHSFGGSVGIGIGRVRDATALFEARVFEDRLQKAGALAHPLSHDARQRLASLFAARSQISAASDRPAPGLWSAIERILRDDAAVVGDGSLKPDAIFQTTAPYFSNGYLYDYTSLPRSPIYWVTGASARWLFKGSTSRGNGRRGYATSRLITRSGVDDPWAENRSSYDDGSRWPSVDALSMGPALSYDRPLNMRWQWGASANSEWSLRKNNWYVEHYADVTLSGIVADRWMLSSDVEYDRQVTRDKNRVQSADIWEWSLGARATYFVTDHVNAYVDFRQSYAKYGADLVNLYYYVEPATHHYSDGQASFGLTYRFAGHASIAGVYPAGAN